MKQKHNSAKHKKYLRLFFITICLTAIPNLIPASALGKQPILNTILNSFQSIVKIESDIVIFAKGPQNAFRDKNSGRILLTRGLRTARFKRTGAGVIIDPSGIIVTNAHTVNKANRINVILQNRKKFPAKVLGIMPSEDIAFLSIKTGSRLPWMGLSDSSKIKLGDKIYTVGSSDILNGTIAEGTITGIGYNNQFRNKKIIPLKLIQTDLNLYKGDSGGPLIDTEGKLLGIQSAMQKSGPSLSYAIPSNIIKFYLKKLQR